MSEITVKETKELLERSAAAQTVEKDGKPYLIRPHDYVIESMERFLHRPTAKRGKLTFTRLASFSKYVLDHEDVGTRIFFDGTKFTAVLDHHGEDLPGWKEHVAIYAPAYSPQWQTWLKSNRIPFIQSTFAEFIEENRADVALPLAGELLDIVRELEAVRDVTFKGALKKDNTVQRIEFEDNTNARTKGNLEVPTEILLRLPVYDGAELQDFPCRLKVTVGSGQLVLQYEMRNLAARLAAIVDALVAEVGEAVEIEPLFGSETA